MEEQKKDENGNVIPPTPADPSEALKAENESLKQALVIEREKNKKQPAQKKNQDDPPGPSLLQVTKEELDEMVKTQVEERVTNEVDELRSSFVKDAFSEELAKISTDPKERDAIVAYYKDRIRPSGVDRTSILKDLQLAKAGLSIDNGSAIAPIDPTEAAARAAAALAGGGSGKPGLTEEPIPADIRELAEAVGIDPAKLVEKSKRLEAFYNR